METRFCKEDPEPMLKLEYSFEDTLMYQEEEDYEPYIKTENEECIKGMIIAESRPETPPRPRQRWRDNAIVTIERQPEYDSIFRDNHVASNERAAAIIDPFNPQHYCAMCDDIFPRRARFRSHIRQVHYLKVKYFKYPYATINPNHPENYCAKCDKTYVGYYFPRHLQEQHDFSLQAFKPTHAIRQQRKPQNDRGSKRGNNKTKHINRHPNAIIDPHHPQYYCAKCDRIYHRNAFRQHLRGVHDLKDKDFKRPTPQAKLVMDPHHPRPYCTECNRSYHYNYFRRHLRNIHGQTMEDFKCGKPRAKLFKDPPTNTTPGDTLLGPRHPLNYCAKCNRSYHRNYFRQHLRNIHGLTDKDFTTTTTAVERQHSSLIGQEASRSSEHLEQANRHLVNNKQQNRCTLCDGRFKNLKGLKQHIVKTHGTTASPIIHPNAKIDILRPDNYCAQCDVKYTSPSTFFAHLQKFHLSILSNVRSSVKMVNKPNVAYYCPKCCRHYTEDLFRQHFWNHRSGRPVVVDPDAHIDLNSPDFYCSKCKMCFETRSMFKTHVIRIHGLVNEWVRAAKQRKILHPHAEIDFFSADNYCAKCDKRWQCRHHFWDHAAILHAAYPPSTDQATLNQGSCNLRNGKKLIPLIPK